MGKEKRQSPSTLLWFIRHKSYVPISEIRRRFLVESEEGSFIQAGGHRRAYVGLPPGTAQSLEKLWHQGKIGLELSVEFDADVLIGVYPMIPSKEPMNGHDHSRRQPVVATASSGEGEEAGAAPTGSEPQPASERSPAETQNLAEPRAENDGRGW